MPARKTSPTLPTLVCSCPQETPGLMPAFPSLREVCGADRQTSSQGRTPEPIPTGCGSVGLQAQESHWEKHRSSLMGTSWPCLPGTWEREIGPCLALGRAIRTQRSWSQEGPRQDPGHTAKSWGRSLQPGHSGKVCQVDGCSVVFLGLQLRQLGLKEAWLAFRA